MNILILPIFLLGAVFQISDAYIKYESQPAAAPNVLSSWELFVLNDLVFQITMKKCPKISRPAASSLKDYISNALKMAPRTIRKQHEGFLPSYKTLLNCFDYVDAHSRNPGKKLESVKFINAKESNPQGHLEEESSDEETDESESDEDSFEELISQSKGNTEKPVEFVTSRLNHAWEDKHGEWHWKWMSQVANTFSNLFRPKREVLEGGDLNPVKKAWHENVQVTQLSDAKDNFIKVLYDMNRIVRLSCPASMKPNGPFSRKTLLELAFWVSLDSRSLIRASGKYFGDDSLIQQVHECIQSL